MLPITSGAGWSAGSRPRAGLTVTTLLKRPLWRMVSGRARTTSQALWWPARIWPARAAVKRAGVTPARQCNSTFIPREHPAAREVSQAAPAACPLPLSDDGDEGRRPRGRRAGRLRRDRQLGGGGPGASDLDLRA